MARSSAPKPHDVTQESAPAPLIATALKCRCPRCGQGRLYSGYLKVVERCADCGLNLASNDSADGPAVFLLFVVGFIALPLAFWINAVYDLPGWAFLAIACTLIVGMTLVLLPPAKALVIGLQYRHLPEDFEGDGNNG